MARSLFAEGDRAPTVFSAFSYEEGTTDSYEDGPMSPLTPSSPTAVGVQRPSAPPARRRRGVALEAELEAAWDELVVGGYAGFTPRR